MPEANEFHNSVGIEFSVAHKLDLKTPGNTYKTKARNGLEAFHCFNSVDGAKAFEKVDTRRAAPPQASAGRSGRR